MKMKFVTTGILVTALSLPIFAHAYHACQCVGYIKNRIGDQSSAGNAYQMRNYLEKNGYHQIDLNSDIPKNKDIIVIRREYGHGYDRNYGHVGIVSSASGSSGSNISVDLVSANMNNTANNPNAYRKHAERSEYNCDNVSGSVLNIMPSEYDKVEVYRR